MNNLARYKSALGHGLPPPEGRLFKGGAFATRIAPEGESRRVTFTISTASVDRDNDTIRLDGWDLGFYRANPLVLMHHDAGAYPVGKTVEIGVADNQLRATVEFMPRDVPDGAGERAESCLWQLRNGFLSATSVGFRPVESKVATERQKEGEMFWPPIDFLKSELMEFSVVTVPANPEALIDPSERTPGDLVPAIDPAAIAEARAEAAVKRQGRLDARRRLLLACV